MTSKPLTEAQAAAAVSAAGTQARPSDDDGWDLPDTEARPLPPLHRAALYGNLGRAASVLSAHTQADVIALLHMILAWFGSIVGFKPWTAVDNSPPHRANIGIVVVGRTGTGRKTTAWFAVRDFLSMPFEALLAAHQTWLAWQWSENVTANVKSGEYVVHMIRDEITTAAGHVSDVGVFDKRKLVYEPEFSRLLKDKGKEGNTLSEIHRQTHDETTLHNGAKTSPEKATNQHVSWVCTSTERDIHTHLAPDDLSNGFANRDMFCISKRSLQSATSDARIAVAPVAQELFEALLASDPYDTQWDGFVPFSADALDFWNSIANGFEAVLVTDDLVGDMEVRFGFHVMKLALIEALANGSRVIEKQHLLASLAIRHHGVGAVEFLFRSVVGANGSKVLAQMHEHPGHRITATEVRDLFSRNLPKRAQASLMDGLVRQGLIRRVAMKVQVGRPPTSWELVEASDRVRSYPSFPSFLAALRERASATVFEPDRLADEPLPDAVSDMPTQTTETTKATKVPSKRMSPRVPSKSSNKVSERLSASTVPDPDPGDDRRPCMPDEGGAA
jgi:hypothetical protein